MIKNNYEHICIVTSAIGSPLGIVPLDDRYKQTLHSIDTIRNKIPNCCIVLNDVSLNECNDYREHVKSLVDVFLDSNGNQAIVDYSRQGLKSHADLLLVRYSLQFVIDYLDLTTINRIFKLSARHSITEEFDIKDYEGTEGKYVFKNPVQSWISPDMKLYEARLFSFHKSLIPDYVSKFPNMFNSCDGRFDLEHTYYKWLDQKDVICFDNIWVEGIVAPDAHYQKD